MHCSRVIGIPALLPPPWVRSGCCGCREVPRQALRAEQPAAQLGKSAPRHREVVTSSPFQPRNSRTSQVQGHGSSDCAFVAINYATHYEFTNHSSTSQFKKTIQLKGHELPTLLIHHQHHDYTFSGSNDIGLHGKKVTLGFPEFIKSIQ